MLSLLKRSLFFLSLILSYFIFLSTMAFPAEEPIAALTDFSGTVLIKSRGKWGVEPTENLPLYSQDKVVTRVGTATITFTDGAVLEIKSNSNVLIQEREKEEGIVGKIKIIERRIFLFLGKLFFKTGKAEIETRFEAATAVIGIRGTMGTLSIAEDGTCWIMFTEGEAAQMIGAFIGEPPLVSQADADANPLQRAAYVAYDTAIKCIEARELAARGDISQYQAEWACAKAAEAAHLEMIACLTELIQKSPRWEGVLEFEQWLEEVLIELNASRDGIQRSIREGATPEYEGFEQPEILRELTTEYIISPPEGAINLNLGQPDLRFGVKQGATEQVVSPTSPQ